MARQCGRYGGLDVADLVDEEQCQQGTERREYKCKQNKQNESLEWRVNCTFRRQDTPQTKIDVV